MKQNLKDISKSIEGELSLLEFLENMMKDRDGLHDLQCFSTSVQEELVCANNHICNAIELIKNKEVK